MSTTPSYARVALVTGATDGIGRAVALELVASEPGARVYVLGRNPAKLDAVVRDARERGLPEGAVIPLRADLVSLDDVRAAADEFLKRETRLDLLVLNAMSIAHERIVTKDGFEQNLVVGFLSRALLERRLEPALRAARGGGHVVNINGQTQQRVDLANPNLDGGAFTALRAMGQMQFAARVYVHHLTKSAPDAVRANTWLAPVVKTKLVWELPFPRPVIWLFLLLGPFMAIDTETAAKRFLDFERKLRADDKRGATFDALTKRWTDIELEPGYADGLVQWADHALGKWLA